MVAFGDAKFRSTMRGVGSAPVKRFRRALEHHATLAPTSEMRTSKLCSKGCGWDGITELATTDEEKKKRETLGVLDAVRGERRASGKPGEALHAVRFCKKGRTMWHRDVNAARNIARMFLWQRTHPRG